ncbi:MAG: ABC transporter permease [Desulfobulbaceae bacterium]|nr:MAG: ABC transporter permease [Desulfobulbaceae bacterium]
MQVLGHNALRFFPYLTLLAFFAPVVVGLFGTWIPALGYLPAIGSKEFSGRIFSGLWLHPSFPKAVWVSLISGVAATCLSFGLSLFITIQLYGSRFWNGLERTISPLLAIPHAAFTIGFIFLISPSGWLIRLVSPGLTGFTFPPDLITNGDPYGISLTITMAIKETPFLLLMIMGGLNQLQTKNIIWVGRSFGYGTFGIWTKLIVPQLYPLIRLPLLTVLAYSLSVVDLAILVGPSAPPTLGVLIDQWFNDPDLNMRLSGAAGASVLFTITLLAIFVVLLLELFVRKTTTGFLINGKRNYLVDRMQWSARMLSGLLWLTTLLSLLILVIWSFTHVWRFPSAWPTDFSERFWQKTIPLLSEPMLVSLSGGCLSTLIAVILVLGCFEYEVYRGRTSSYSVGRTSRWLIYTPLLVPQIGFMFGVQIVFTLMDIQGSWLGLIWVHLIFVLPYVFLTLAQPYRNYDQRYMDVAISLSQSRLISYFRIKLIMLSKPILFSMAIGFSVSIAQYVSTLYIGAGRFATITTETVSLASGSDRRIIAVYGLCQFLLPFMIYSLAIVIPALLFRNRRGMQN